jgi:drug/metabolite transporter (DMT)-like permease
LDTLLLVLTNVIGGSSYPANAVMLRGFAPGDALFVRTALCALLFLPFLWRARRRLGSLPARDWALMAGVGTFGYALPLALGNYGQTLSTASSAALFIGMEPVSIVALSCVFLGERLTGLKLLSMAAGLSGATLIAFQGPPHLGAAVGGRMAGDLVLAAAGGCWALYTVIGKPVLARVEPLDYTAATTVLCFLGVAAWTAPGLSPSAWRHAGPSAWLAVLYLAAFGSFLGALVWNVVLRRVAASRQANSIFLQPLVGVALGAGLLGDPLTKWTASGGALVLAGMWIATHVDADIRHIRIQDEESAYD